MRLIDAFIVGAQKCGTTSLLRYMSEHPDILGHQQIEMSFFSKDIEYKEGYSKAWRKYYHSSDKKEPVVIAKNSHMYSNTQAIERLYHHNSACKFILIIRNPVDRAYSSYLMEKNAWGQEYSFDKTITNSLKKKDDWHYRIYLEFGIYHYHIEKILKYFGGNFSVIKLDDLIETPEETVMKLYTFLGVHNHFLPDLSKLHNVTTKVWSEWYGEKIQQLFRENNIINRKVKSIISNSITYKLGQFLRNINRKKGTHEKMSSNTREKLVEFYRPHNAQLSRMLNIDINEWDN